MAAAAWTTAAFVFLLQWPLASGSGGVTDNHVREVLKGLPVHCRSIFALDREPESNIPRRIIQTWHTKQLTGELLEWNLKLQALHPTWEYLLFDDADVDAFVDRFYPHLRRTWAKLTGPIRVQRYDLFRLLIVNSIGGFYLDIDVEPLASLEPLVNLSLVFPHEEMIPTAVCERQRGFGRWPWQDILCGEEFEQLGQYAFGAEAGHPFLQHTIETMVAAINDPAVQRKYADVYIFTTTGPDHLTHIYKHAPLYLTSNATVLFPEPYAKFSFGPFARHDMHGSWR